MIKLTLILLTLSNTLICDAQIRREFTGGGDHRDSLVDGNDYYFHLDHKTHVGLAGKCNNLTLELDDESGINFRGLQVKGDLTIQSINGGSQVVEEDVTHNYANDLIFEANDIIVKHFDNPNSTLRLEHTSFRTAYLGSSKIYKTDFWGKDKNDDGTEAPYLVKIDPCIDCSSVNGGGLINIVVRGTAVGFVLGQTKVLLLKTTKQYNPDITHLKGHDCSNCITIK